MSKLVEKINQISAMKTFSKPNCNLCMDKCLKTLKKLRDKHVMVMNKKFYIQGLPAQNNFHQFLLSTDDIVKRMKGLGFTIAFKT